MHCLCLKNKAWVVNILEKKISRLKKEKSTIRICDDEQLCIDVLAAARDTEGDELLVGTSLLKILEQYQAEEGV